jgi:hypothetical protein
MTNAALLAAGARLALAALDNKRLAAVIDRLLKSTSPPQTLEQWATEALREDPGLQGDGEEWPAFRDRVAAVLKSKGINQRIGNSQLQRDGQANDGSDKSSGMINPMPAPDSAEMSMLAVAELHRRYPPDPAIRLSAGLSLADAQAKGPMSHERRRQVTDEYAALTAGQRPGAYRPPLDDKHKAAVRALSGTFSIETPPAIGGPEAETYLLTQAEGEEIARLCQQLVEIASVPGRLREELAGAIGRVLRDLAPATQTRNRPAFGVWEEAKQLLAQARAETAGR